MYFTTKRSTYTKQSKKLDQLEIGCEASSGVGVLPDSYGVRVNVLYVHAAHVFGSAMVLTRWRNRYRGWWFLMNISANTCRCAMVQGSFESSRQDKTNDSTQGGHTRGAEGRGTCGGGGGGSWQSRIAGARISSNTCRTAMVQSSFESSRRDESNDTTHGGVARGGRERGACGVAPDTRFNLSTSKKRCRLHHKKKKLFREIKLD